MYTLGGNAVIYYSSSTPRATWPGTGTAGGLQIIRHVGDLKLPLEKNEADATTRDTPGFETSIMTLIKGSVQFKLIKDTADAGYQALRNNFFSTNGACIPIAVMDGPSGTVGTEGLWADMQVSKFERGEPVKDLQTIDVELKLALNTAAGTNALGPQYIVTGTGPIIG